MFASSGAALAEKRVALVIGNSAYKHAPELANPKNDATDMAAALKGVGVEVIPGFDLDKPGMERAIRAFAAALSNADVGILFYAGHGLQVSGNNYLVPVDAELSTVAALEFEAVRLDLVQRLMENAAKTNILFLDACRNNPLSRNLARAMGARGASIGRGLAPAESGVGTLVSFSTQPGNVALDGTGRNSPFAGPLVAALATPNEDLLSILTGVRNSVLKETGGKQVPWENHALTERFYFTPPKPVEAPPVAVAVTDEAAREWAEVDKTNEIDLRTFIVRHGETRHGAYAKARLAALDGEKAARAKEAAAKQKADDELSKRRDADAAETKRKEDQRVAMLAAEDEKKRKEAEDAGAGGQGSDPAETCSGVETVVAEAKRCLAIKESFRDCEDMDADGNFICPEMVVIPAGEFTMGSPKTEKGHNLDEEPQREVTIAKPFAAGKYEVTFAEWDACVAAKGCKHKPETSWERGRQPVINVSWNDAKEYAAWLSTKTGQAYRLLSEAEWEYAARAETTGPFSFDGTITTDKANYNGNYIKTPQATPLPNVPKGSPFEEFFDEFNIAKGTYRQRSVAVDETAFPANPWGLFHVHGNVSEWVEDCHHENYRGAPSDGSAWTKDCLKSDDWDARRMLRGGSWRGDPESLRSASRDRCVPSCRNNEVGFRIGRAVSP